jgi:hypothetical protein
MPSLQPAVDLKVQSKIVGPGMLALMVGAWLSTEFGRQHATLFLVGALLGVTLYHAAFGFTSAYRRMFVQRDVTAVRPQLLMLAAATVLFAPVLSDGTAFGHPVVGAVAPLGIQVAVGAFIFGLGMQLGGGCGSGTLFMVGGGSARMVLTLIAFCAGSFVASLHMQWWIVTPRLPAIALSDTFGWSAAVALQLILLFVLSELLRRWGAKNIAYPDIRGFTWHKLTRGPWPYVWGGLALAALNWVTLVVSGHPWTITWAFTLWGAKAAQLLGWNPGGVWFWSGGFTENALNSSIWADETSIMDIGILIGAFIAAGAAGRFAPTLRIPLRSIIAAVLGGLLMGYGARIAFGCNIGAFFSGVASTSLHGWLWIICALSGTWIGVKLRPWFGLANE